MIQVINTSESRKRAEFMARLQSRSVPFDPVLLGVVSAIIEDVRQRGDEALVEYAARFDDVEMTPSDLRVSEEQLRTSAAAVDERMLSVLRAAIGNVRTFHEQQLEQSWTLIGDGVQLRQRLSPIESVGVYVPGGTAAYPSSVVMNAVPAQVAGVSRIAVATPPRTVRDNPAVAAALQELGITEIYEIGGAQAIAALAFGTETIAKVDKITGPGNKYVAAAKKIVFGAVGIDSIAGPSEVVIVADDSARADFVAADLLAQAEHGEDASAILITTSEDLARNVVTEVDSQLSSLPRCEIAKASISAYGAILIVESLTEACAIVNGLAPEHLELLTGDNQGCAQKVKHAGAIFLGPYSPEALGDYFAGPNHVLPTGGTARFSSALGVYDFIKRTNLIEYSQQAMQTVVDDIALFAETEGLQAHARSALLRRAN